MNSVPSDSIMKNRSTSCSKDILNLERTGKDTCVNKGFINSYRNYERKWIGPENVKGARIAKKGDPHLHPGQELKYIMSQECLTWLLMSQQV